MIKKRSWLILLCCVWFLNGATVRAQTTSIPDVTSDAAVNFPFNITFSISGDPAEPLDSATLHYEVEKFSCVELATEVSIDVIDNEAEWTWEMIRSGNPPPGAEVRYWWSWTTGAGGAGETAVQTIVLEDQRFAWRTVDEAGITLHWYAGDEVGPTLLDAAVDGLDRLEAEMGIELVDSVELWIYGDSDDMREAVLYIQEWAGGVAFTEYNTILMGVPPRIVDSWGRSTIQHELAHLVIGQLGRSCLGGGRPTWLEEGLAVVAEGEPSEDILASLEAATANDTFEPVRSLNGAFPAHDVAAGIAYSQSYSLVRFLLDAYGAEAMQTLLLRLTAGDTIDEALEAVYGFNVDGFELAWRAANQLPPRTIPPTPTAVQAAAIPTFEPAPVLASVPTPPAAAEPPAAVEAPSTGGCALGLLPLFLLVGVGSGTAVRRRRKDV